MKCVVVMVLYVTTYPLFSVDIVGKGFIQLLEDENKVGEAMRITAQKGIDYHPFPSQEIPY